MEIFKIMLDGAWNNVFSKSVTFGPYSFPLWIPPVFGIVCALVIRFLGGGTNE